MGFGVSILSLASGALALVFDTTGGDIDTVGVILLIVGTLGLLMSLLLWDDWRIPLDDEQPRRPFEPRVRSIFPPASR